MCASMFRVSRATQEVHLRCFSNRRQCSRNVDGRPGVALVCAYLELDNHRTLCCTALVESNATCRQRQLMLWNLRRELPIHTSSVGLASFLRYFLSYLRCAYLLSAVPLQVGPLPFFFVCVPLIRGKFRDYSEEKSQEAFFRW